MFQLDHAVEFIAQQMLHVNMMSSIKFHTVNVSKVILVMVLSLVNNQHLHVMLEIIVDFMLHVLQIIGKKSLNFFGFSFSLLNWSFLENHQNMNVFVIQDILEMVLFVHQKKTVWMFHHFVIRWRHVTQQLLDWNVSVIKVSCFFYKFSL